jgi:transcriptional regulator with XRE-family HTH domain
MKSESFKKIGNYFRGKRLGLGLSQQAASNFLGCSSKQIISNWERGVSAPPLDYIGDLIVLYKLDQKEVLKLFLDVRRADIEAKFGSRRKKAKSTPSG